MNFSTQTNAKQTKSKRKSSHIFKSLARSTTVKITAKKQINSMIKPVCVSLLDISSIINLNQNTFTTKLLNESTYNRIRTIEQNSKLANQKTKNDVTTNIKIEQSIDYSDKFETLKRCSKKL